MGSGRSEELASEINETWMFIPSRRSRSFHILLFFSFRCSVRLFVPRTETVTDFYVQSMIDGEASGWFRSDAPSHSAEGSGANGVRNRRPGAKENVKRKQMFGPAHTSAGHTISTLSGSGKGGSGAGKANSVDNGDGTKSTEDKSVHKPNNSILELSYSRMKRSKRVKVANYHFDHCNQDFWSENVAADSGKELFLRKWSYNLSGAKNKTVRFR